MALCNFHHYPPPPLLPRAWRLIPHWLFQTPFSIFSIFKFDSNHTIFSHRSRFLQMYSYSWMHRIERVNGYILEHYHLITLKLDINRFVSETIPNNHLLCFRVAIISASVQTGMFSLKWNRHSQLTNQNIFNFYFKIGNEDAAHRVGLHQGPQQRGRCAWECKKAQGI